MADEERDTESSTDEETNVSDDVVDTDSVSRGDESGDDVDSAANDSDGGDESTDESGDDAGTAADDSDDSDDQPDEFEPVYGRVTPPEESVTDESDDSEEDDDITDESASDEPDADADAADDDESDTLVVGEPGDGLFPVDSELDDEGEDETESDDGDDEAADADAADEDETADDEDDESDKATDDESDDVLSGPPDPYDTSTAVDDDDDGILGSGIAGSAPETDQEMPLTDHIEEMIRRLAIVLGVAGLVTLVLFPGADILNAYVDTGLPSATDVINFLWNTHIPAADSMADRRPRLYGPLELILTKLKVAGLAGTVIGLPVFVYQTYLFMRPGLYPKERKYYLAAVPTSLVLAVIGVIFAHFVVLPAIFAYFTSYTEGTAVIAFGLKETFNLILILMGYMAIVFQIPLFVELAIMMKLVTRVWLEDRRLLFWGAFLGLAFLVSPDPTGMAPIIIAATMIVLFEGTLAVLRWTGN
ncbi:MULTISPECIES: twin-arginine translocase subunit TatC [Haloferax]|uniref:Sec-independent protein translocase protein TatC n=1 Tax=Haloferax marinum TaxID=2666143 RepID=A0A6A8G7S5_9EURY|nr:MULTISPECIES: twin-arginine translocase subunit TatC [Haloferax]KAB1197545.1 MFS transporter [Haloferax sp. CBA1150]MRW96592.1 MFS transporter [Haloferax marinum]